MLLAENVEALSNTDYSYSYSNKKKLYECYIKIMEQDCIAFTEAACEKYRSDHEYDYYKWSYETVIYDKRHECRRVYSDTPYDERRECGPIPSGLRSTPPNLPSPVEFKKPKSKYL